MNTTDHAPRPVSLRAPMVITVTRTSSRYMATFDVIPEHAIVRMEGMHWNESSRVLLALRAAGYHSRNGVGKSYSGLA